MVSGNFNAIREDYMHRTVGLVVALALAVGSSTWVSAQSGAAALEGAWAVQEVTTAKPANNAMKKPVGLVLFTGTHYSIVYADAVRADFGQGGAGAATADQLRAAWGPVTANTGTFAVTGNTVRMTRTAAKAPPAMAAGNFMEYSFTRNGDTLALTQIRTDAGPAANPQTLRLTRAR
jgi:hypothetical protein